VRQTLSTFAKIAGGIVLFGLFAGVPLAAGSPAAAGGVLLALLVNGWGVYAFLRYRQARQDELVYVLAAAVEAGLPLAPAVRAYLYDRPRRTRLRAGLWVAAVIFLPLYAYTRVVMGWWSFDMLVRELAARLEDGESLSEALRNVPGVAGREVRLAAAVGEETSGLAACLRSADRERWGAAWLEVAPRFVYPFVVFVFVLSLTTFLMVFIVPKYQRIFQEFGEHLPVVTEALISTAGWFSEELLLSPPALLFGLAAVAAVLGNPTVRWYTPFLGRLYRWEVQAQVLRTIGRLLTAGRTVPQALAFLADSADLPQVVRRRLATAMTHTQRGDPLDAALERAGLLPPPMAPLVRSAERVRTLPWALGELGDHLAGRAFRLVRRVSLIVAPLLVAALGAVVGFVALAMFLPLIHLLTRLSEW
jgi:type IV pilus assembly protein PilC